jgi:serine/threonine protein phosphatase 1
MFLNRLLRPRADPQLRAPPEAPERQVVFALGDVHGRSDLLAALLQEIGLDLAIGAGAATLVFVGDYVDRGPDSRGVLDQLLSLRARGLGALVFLRGNHDQMLLDFLADPATGPQWMSVGGSATLTSYGLAPPGPSADPAAWGSIARVFADALPPAHRVFLEDLQLFHRAGDYVFAHAGVRPGRPLEKQTARDLLWIRQAFLSGRRPLPWTVVHGHTPCERVHADLRRIGIDTGAYATDVLTALRLEGAARELLQTRRDEDGSIAVIRGELPLLGAAP